MKGTRAYKAGTQLGQTIVEMVHLMYQNQTAKRFFSGLMKVLNLEHKRRR